MKLYLIAGEASGDFRGAEVMRSLTMLAAARGEPVEFHGAGGPKMKALAPVIQDWSGEAVVGLWDVLKKYRYFKRQFNAMLAEIRAKKPDAVVLIDYPGFNLRIAKALKRRDPGLLVIYYISPQVWAWNRGRIPQMARTLDLMLCIFPFEKALYEKSGLKTVFVGHPMLDSLASEKNPALYPRHEMRIGLFPGSRAKEVQRIFPPMVDAARDMRRAWPGLRFEAAAATEELAVKMRDVILEYSWAVGPPIEVTVGSAHRIMQEAAAGMVASGTATMEAAFFEMPFVLVYKVAPLTWEVGKRLVRVPHLGMVNILAGRSVVTEFLQDNALPQLIADEMLSLLNTPEKRDEQLENLRAVIASLGAGGASLRAAEAILAEIAGKGG